MDLDIVALKKRRTTIKASCTRIKGYIDKLTSVTPAVISEVEERRLKLEQLWSEYDLCQSQIESVDEVESADRAKFEDSFFNLAGRMRELSRPAACSRQASSPSPAPSNISESQASLFSVRLPKLDLPKFSGKYDEWFPFHDAFHSIIHSNASLGDVHKLQYLRSAVSGDANKVIGSLEMSDTNYAVAWNLLKERYDNKRVIVQGHLRALLELPTMGKENALELRQIADGAQRHVHALQALKRPVHMWDDLLIHILNSKLDSHTAREWQASLTGTEMPTLKQFLDFLAHRCQVLESTSRLAGLNSKSTHAPFHTGNKQKISCHSSVAIKCHFCQGEHAIYQCQSFLALPIFKRISEVRSKGLCLNCLRTTAHFASKCTGGACKVCSRKHNTLLHIAASSDQPKPDNPALQGASPTVDSSAGIPQSVVTHASGIFNNGQSLLSTAVVLAQDKDGVRKPCRVLLDSGSQANLISREFLNSLKLPTRTVNITISGINGTATRATQAVQIRIHSRVNSFSILVDCIVSDKVTDNLPAFTVDRKAFKFPGNIEIADPTFHLSSSIDLLLGADVFWDLLCLGRIKATHSHPALQKTRFGWILAGRLNSKPSRSLGVQVHHASISNTELHDQLTKFWRLDDIRVNSNNRSQEERFCEDHFLENVSRSKQGRYIVRLPFKEELMDSLGSSKEVALKRFSGIERRFERDQNLKARYSQFMEEYISLGHMKPVIGASADSSQAYYLPHHSVVKQSVEGSKIRVVFDGSCKTDSGLSLNDCLLTGPLVQDDLISILIRFRTFKYVLVADIIKMYRQILVHPSQTRWQRIFWRNKATSNLQIFELTTVTYGTASASYLATRCLLHLAQQYATHFPVGSARLRRDFYVDDLLTGANTLDEAKIIRDQIIEILARGCFELSKWGSNCPVLLSGISDQREELVPFHRDTDFRILGIIWNRTSDVLHFKGPVAPLSEKVTKRSILSETSKLFDPLGFIGPIIVLFKLILQELWQAGVDWDESVPQDIHSRWLHLRLQLSSLSQLQIPRCVGTLSEPNLVQIHGFCDASQRAYGACIYILVQINKDEYQSNLLCSKSRVAPLKAISLPRLELSAALLLAQLFDKIKSALDLTGVKTVLWSDSTIALTWLTSPSRKWSTFVANRVGEIQQLTDITHWRHVPSRNNPADILSRGSLPVDLIESHLWWHGPPFLNNPDDQWPSGNFLLANDPVPEQKVVRVFVASLDYNILHDLFNRFSNLHKVCRILAYCRRLSLSRATKPTTVVVSPKEIQEALNAICRIIQRQVFASEYNSLINNQPLDKATNLLTLSPFLGNDGLIRVGGRLKNSALPYDSCHQVVLPRNHELTNRIIMLEHRRALHAGVQGTMAAVRQRFWPISLRSTTRKIINKCITCFRALPRFSEAIMGSLPATRVQASRPFAHCGVDYAGPVSLREGNRRNSRNHKAYVAVFVCFATKAVHLEVVSDLTTNAFIAALKRLISRRGKPQRMYSDNGTTFVGAHNYIRELYEFLRTDEARSEIESFLRDQQTEWTFIPPHAPHQGGLWEAAVKSAKRHLTRIVGTANLTFEEMQTTLCEIEAVLNSRPLVPLSSDPNDLSYISPGHFLVGSPLNSFPFRDISDTNTNTLTRWQMVEQMRQHFWLRWSSEYLNSLQERHKWQTSRGPQLDVGQLVLIKQPGAAPLHWITGRVEGINAGTDGIARSATVRTVKGSYLRPLSKLAILPT